MDTNDLDLKLCSRDPIFVGNVPIYPISIRRIAEIGYSKFNTEVRLLCLNESDVAVMTGHDISEIGIFTYLLANAMSDQSMMDLLVFWLSEITRNRVMFSERKMCFVSRAFEINRDNFNEIQMVIRCRNGLRGVDEEAENPANEAARRVLKRRKEERMKRHKAKLNEIGQPEITLSDLVSILASGLKMTMQDVMEYDLYQFNDQFNRLKIIDNYDVSIQALLHGAKKEDVNLVHWITKIKQNDDD